MGSTAELGAEIIEITTDVDDVPGSTVRLPNRIQHLRSVYSPMLLDVSADYDSSVLNIGAFHTVGCEHLNGIRAGGVGTGKGGKPLILVEERRHVRAKKDKRTWTEWKWHLIPAFHHSQDGLNV